jgi:hypothetical protein
MARILQIFDAMNTLRGTRLVTGNFNLTFPLWSGRSPALAGERFSTHSVLSVQQPDHGFVPCRITIALI